MRMLSNTFQIIFFISASDNEHSLTKDRIPDILVVLGVLASMSVWNGEPVYAVLLETLLLIATAEIILVYENIPILFLK